MSSTGSLKNPTVGIGIALNETIAAFTVGPTHAINKGSVWPIAMTGESTFDDAEGSEGFWGSRIKSTVDAKDQTAGYFGVAMEDSPIPVPATGLRRTVKFMLRGTFGGFDGAVQTDDPSGVEYIQNAAVNIGRGQNMVHSGGLKPVTDFTVVGTADGLKVLARTAKANSGAGTTGKITMHFNGIEGFGSYSI